MNEKMRLCDIENLFENIREIIDFIENSRYKNRRFRLFLGNGDRLNFYVPNESIAHLLGVNTNYLISTGRFNSTNSFELLKELTLNPYRINKLENEHHIDYNLLFSQYVVDKVKSFRQNIKLDITEIQFICKYDSNRVHFTGELSEKFDYIIVKKYSDGKIGILSIVKNDGLYVPMSNQIYDDIDSAKDTLEKYLKYQEITIVNGINSYNIETDYDTTANLNIKTKSEKITYMKEYKNIFNYSIDLSGDYQHAIGVLKRNKDSQDENNDIINNIINSISSGKLIDTEITEDENLVGIINSYNDHLTNSIVDKNVSKKYTNILKELEFFKSECEKLKLENNNLSIENNSLTDEINRLTDENNNHLDKEKKILKILKPEN